MMLNECFRKPTSEVEAASKTSDLPYPNSADSACVGKSNMDVENMMCACGDS